MDAPKSEARDDGKYIRFWMKPATKTEVIFLTSASGTKSLYEHKVKVLGKWRTFTCLSCAGESCPMCVYADSTKGAWKSFATLFTVLSPWVKTEQDGTEKTVLQKKVLVAGKKSLNMLKLNYENLAEVGKDLRGAKFKVSRGPDKLSLATGDAYTYVGHVDLSSMEDTSDLDYTKYFAPDREGMVEALESLTASFEEPSEPNWK